MTDKNIVSKDDLVGIWKLIEVKSVDNKQKIVYPYGRNPVGYTIYTQEGYISCSVMMSNRLNLGLPIQEMFIMAYSDGGQLKLANIFKYIKSAIRYIQAGNKYGSYISKYEIRDDKLIYHIEVSIIPDLIGTELENTVEISEDILVLTRLYGENKDNSVISSWQRVS
ncbi:lipocalin-like domain-containing protein [Okeania hirsuta]|uniref:lipocalin-like domain-containing protein n=1 Tax=Okeania hirsuta TaxID=1458930 RepID=UPI000F51D6D2|nr:lipocalin-like domain-containing protein [Okeania hirsuta]AZH23837.1 MgiS [Okeania hirsuta]RQH04074.1 MgiS [Okeania hirsuta]